MKQIEEGCEEREYFFGKGYQRGAVIGCEQFLSRGKGSAFLSRFGERCKPGIQARVCALSIGSERL